MQQRTMKDNGGINPVYCQRKRVRSMTIRAPLITVAYKTDINHFLKTKNY